MSPAVCPSGITRGLCREERWESAGGLAIFYLFSIELDSKSLLRAQVVAVMLP